MSTENSYSSLSCFFPTSKHLATEIIFALTTQYEIQHFIGGKHIKFRNYSNSCQCNTALLSKDDFVKVVTMIIVPCCKFGKCYTSVETILSIYPSVVCAVIIAKSLKMHCFSIKPKCPFL